MRRLSFAMGYVCLLVPLYCLAGNVAIVPTTTLVAESSGNTSTAANFKTQSNGNVGAANVSKLDIHSLLYAGASTKVYAHLVLWFGPSNHMSVGYSSTDPAQVKRQINDMISRGIDGVIIDWYGPNNAIDQATQLVMHEAENHPGFTFAVMVDQGAIQWDSCAGCTPQQALIQQLQYVEQEYFPSPAYLRLEGAPVIGNFDIDLHYTVDWKAAAATLATNPAFIFQNNGGFTHVLSDGSDSWVMPATSDYGMSYLTSFYQTGMQYGKESTLGGAYKGFNDSLAAWGSNRVMGQRCGTTWLQTFSKINSLYNSSRQLPGLQLVTWNDYEEGTEIESGIDNCVSVSATLSGSSLQWKISGSESTIDHYVTYISSDGQNLMPLAEVATGSRALNLCSYSLASRNYKLYVQAIGKPTLTNHISASVSYTPHCGGASNSAISLIASPSSVRLAPNASATSQITAMPQSGALSDALELSCSGLPQGLACSFNPKLISAGASQRSSTLTISRVATESRRQDHRQPLYATYWLGFGVAGFVGMGRFRRWQKTQISLLLTLVVLVILFSSCGGGGIASKSVPSVGVAPGTYSISISGVSAGLQVSTPATLTIE